MLRKRSSPCVQQRSSTAAIGLDHLHNDDDDTPLLQDGHYSYASAILCYPSRRLIFIAVVTTMMVSLYYSLVWVYYSGVLGSRRHEAGRLSTLRGGGISSTTAATPPDAIVVGSGIAGLSAALTILDRGGHVVIIEKEHTVGGNSKKASSGMNACCSNTAASTTSYGDSLELFRHDTTTSAGKAAQPALIQTLVSQSQNALEWVETRLELPLTVVAQLGGHSVPRTHRPTDGMVGSELVLRLQQQVTKHRHATILTDTTVTKLIHDDDNGRVIGIEYQQQQSTLSSSSSLSPSDNRRTASVQSLIAPHVILATGGFAADRSNTSWLARVRPELLHFGTTAGAFSTGDGIALGTGAGAATLDLEKIQLHPTGFVDPAQPMLGTKILAAELLRGVGGILINTDGRRFANELGLRSYVTDRMLQHDASYMATGEWHVDAVPPSFGLVLSAAAADKARKHVDFYVSKGLMRQVVGIDALAEYLQVSVQVLQETLRDYRDYAEQGKDPFDKTIFPDLFEQDDGVGIFYVGHVTPVLHYCMGGLKIDPAGHVLDEHGLPIGGLYAAGEVTGGVHGDNRLGGNSLLECTVFGRVVGEQIPIRTRPLPRKQTPVASSANPSPAVVPAIVVKKPHLKITLQELTKHQRQQHNDDEQPCWVALLDRVYDLTAFALEHAGGRDPIHLYCGKDATETFHMIHSSYVKERLSDLPLVGDLVNDLQ